MDPGSFETGRPDFLGAVRDPERLEAIRETGLHDPEASDSLGYLTSLALRALDCSTAFISVVDEDEVLVRASRGDPAPLLDNGPVPVEKSFCQNMVGRAEPLVVRDVSEEESIGSDLAADNGLISYLEVPLHLTEDVVIGGFCIAEPRPRDWTDEEVEMLETFAAGAASEIRLRRQVRRLRARESELEARALHDPLTDLANRHLLWDRVEHALARTERTGAHIGILFLDIDDFKAVNDRYGHTAGDRVLAEVGRRLQERVRGHDTAARFGGDEFVVLLEDLTDPAQAGRIAERIADTLMLPIELEDESVVLSPSIGVALRKGSEVSRFGDEEQAAAEDDAPSPLASQGRRLVQEADWAMYRAKRTKGTSWARY